jgi:hypothetical protein
MPSFPSVLFVLAGLLALTALTQLVTARRRWRDRHRFGALHRLLWGMLFLLLAALGALGGAALLGWQRLSAEATVAQLQTRELSPQHYAVTIETPDGVRREVELRGDDWQLDAHVIKWKSRALMLGAPPLYRLERISGRWRDIEQERSSPKSVHALSSPTALDLWQLHRRYPQHLSWVDADYGSGAWLPLVDGGRFTVTLAAAGGLVARPADAVTERAVRQSGWSSD